MMRDDSPVGRWHWIRLAGPWWAVARHGSPAEGCRVRFHWPTAQRAALTAESLVRDPEPTATEAEDWLRIFHRPSGLLTGQSVVLELCDLPPLEAVILNGRPLERGDPTRPFEIHSWLQPENELRLQPRAGARPCGLVRLGIEEASPDSREG
jgi:hypothetical protein